MYLMLIPRCPNRLGKTGIAPVCEATQDPPAIAGLVQPAEKSSMIAEPRGQGGEVRRRAPSSFSGSPERFGSAPAGQNIPEQLANS